MQNYRLLDCGDQKKVEVFGDYTLIRPCPQALWKPFSPSLWQKPDAEFERGSSEKGDWKQISKDKLPESWETDSASGLTWKITPNEFGNVGVFTEHWTYVDELVKEFEKGSKVLDLFSYSGSNAMSLIKAGFKVTAVDSSKNAMDTYTANMEANNLPREGQRLILEDVYKFLAREIRREAKYDAILMDAPSYGRGTKGEVFKIEDDLVKLLESSRDLLTENGKLIVTLHSPRFTPAILEILCTQIFADKTVNVAEIIQECESGARLPSGFLVKIG
jgi:23S rRNA (cytosine1962-C5)-methyltransferase